MDKYIEKNYSFVVTWVAGSNSSVRQPGVMIDFPTEKFYYPLILTSIYGDDIIPIEILVVGHVSPIIYKEIEPYARTTYWSGYLSTNSYYTPFSPEIRNFTTSISGRLEFTKIELNAPSSAFKKDLWIERKAPAKVWYADSLYSMFDNSFDNTNSFPTLIIIHLLLSLLAGFIAALLISWSKKEKLTTYILMGYGNFIGIFGLLLTSFIVGKCTRISTNRVALFIVWFFVVYIMLVFAAYNILLLPLQL